MACPSVTSHTNFSLSSPRPSPLWTDLPISARTGFTRLPFPIHVCSEMALQSLRHPLPLPTQAHRALTLPELSACCSSFCPFLVSLFKYRTSLCK